jgi:hypothetical protein
LTTLLTVLISLQVTTTCLPTRRTGCDHSASTIMSWWEASKHCWAHKWQTSLKQAYKISFPDLKIVSIPIVTMLRSSLNMHVFFVYNKTFLLIVCFVNNSPEVTFWTALLYAHTLPSICKIIS